MRRIWFVVFGILFMLAGISQAASVIFNITTSNSVYPANFITNAVLISNSPIIISANLSTINFPLYVDVNNGITSIYQVDNNLVILVNASSLTLPMANTIRSQQMQIGNLSTQNTQLKGQLTSNKTLLLNETNKYNNEVLSYNSEVSTVNSLQSQINTENSFFISHQGNMTSGSKLLNSTYHLNLTCSQPNLNLRQNVNPSWQSNIIYSNATYNVIFTVNQISKLNLNITLPYSSSYYNNTYGIAIRTQPLTANSLNTSIIQAWYEAQPQNNCLQWTNITTNDSGVQRTEAICARTETNPNVSIFNICIGDSFLSGKLVPGLGQCFLQAYSDANQTNQNSHQALLACQSQLASNQSILTSYKTGSNYASNWINSALGLLQYVAYIVAAVILAWGWTHRISKSAPQSMTRPKPIKKLGEEK